jgi:hypothetical protein
MATGSSIMLAITTIINLENSRTTEGMGRQSRSFSE